MIPTSEPAKRLATIMRRRLTTHWASPEIIAFRQLVKDKAFENLEDLTYVETYYAWNWKKEGNICRTSLLTLLRHFPCEVDRARRWAELHPAQFRKSNPDLSPKKPWYKPSEKRVIGSELSDEEWKSVAQLTQTQLREFRKTWMKKHYDLPQNTISGQDDGAAKGEPPKEEPPAAQRAEEDSLLLPNL